MDSERIKIADGFRILDQRSAQLQVTSDELTQDRQKVRVFHRFGAPGWIRRQPDGARQTHVSHTPSRWIVMTASHFCELIRGAGYLCCMVCSSSIESGCWMPKSRRCVKTQAHQSVVLGLSGYQTLAVHVQLTSGHAYDGRCLLQLTRSQTELLEQLQEFEGMKAELQRRQFMVQKEMKRLNIMETNVSVAHSHNHRAIVIPTWS